ncbi:MAG: hypothetical protein QW430_12270 [Metallosphaera sp.]|uniref:hypothetical protein n=1 Tax=Metallosphaera sp. TaxID=2020860 RepID=UPI0031661C77
MKQKMTHPISPVNEEEIEGEIEKEHKIFFEIGKQLNEIIVQTLSENVVNSNKDIEKMIKSIVKDIKDTIEPYLTSLQNHAEEYDFLGWINPDRHLVYLTHLNAGLKIYTALTGDDAAQVRQKLNELEGEVYKTLSLMYTLIVSKKSSRLKTIEDIINSSVKVHSNRAIYNTDTIFCKLENVKIENEAIKMLLDRVVEEAKKFREELEKFKSEKVKITSVDDIIAFIKKFSKLLEQSALAAMWTELIYEEDEEFYEELNIQYLLDSAYKGLMFVVKALRGEEIGWFEEENEKRSK